LILSTRYFITEEIDFESQLSEDEIVKTKISVSGLDKTRKKNKVVIDDDDDDDDDE
jgi:hypothetical protein